MSDTVTIHNGYCSYHGPAEKAPAWAPNVLKSDVAGELRREKFQHGGKAANTRYSTPSDTQPSGRDPVHDNSDITKTAKRVSHIFSAPLTSFEDTTHAWEEGYRAGVSNTGKINNAPSGGLISREAALKFFQPETSTLRKRICDDIRALPAAPTGKEIW